MNVLGKKLIGLIVLASVTLCIIIVYAVNVFPLDSKPLSAADKEINNMQTDVIQAENSEGGNSMQTDVVHADAKSAELKEPIIIRSIQTECNEFEDAQKLATFKIKVPQNIPEGFMLVSIQHVKPDFPNAIKGARNDTVSAVYSNGKSLFNVIQGHFSGGDVAIGPETAAQGKVDVAGVEGKWVQGSWNVVEEPSTESKGLKEWRDSTLDLGWYKDNLGYAILANGVDLDGLVKVANSME